MGQQGPVEVALTVRESAGLDRRAWPMTCGVPLADGLVAMEVIGRGGYRLLDEDGRAVPCQAEAAASWGTYPGGSNGFLRWLHVHFPADLPPRGERRFRLQVGPGVTNEMRTDLLVRDDPDAVTIITGRGAGALRLTISKRRFSLLEEVRLDLAGDGFADDDVILAPREEALLRVAYDHREAVAGRFAPRVVVEQAGPVLAVVRAAAKLDERFESVVRIFAWAGAPYVRIQETLIHGPTGQDRSAVRAQAVVMKAHVMELPVRVEPGQAVATVGVGEALPEPPQWSACRVDLARSGRAVLEQDLSHPCVKDNVGPDGLSRAFSYALFADGRPVHSGQRAPGWADLSDRRWGVTAAVRYFWQTFPKRLVVEPGRLRLEHWAEGAALEPLSRNFNWMGMARTHDVWLYFHPGPAEPARSEQVALGHVHEVFAACTPEQYCSSRAYGRQRLAPAERNGKPLHPEHDELVASGLNRRREGPAGFHGFREREDDYGYFNFGDFLVGPYWGCQEYDPGYCMLQQFYRTGATEYLQFAAECARLAYDVLYSHTYTPATSNYPQRSHDKGGSHFDGEDSHGQRDMNTDPGHVFLAGLVNYWFLTGDRRARDVIFWSLPAYLGDDFYRISGGGTWRYLGGYLLTVFCYAYELTWDDRYVQAMLWAARQYMVHGRTRHPDGIWWNRDGDGYMCQPWLADSVTNGYTQLLEVYPGCPYRREIESAVVNLADFLLANCLVEDCAGVIAQQHKPAPDSRQVRSAGSVYRHTMPALVCLTPAKAWQFTGDEKYLQAVRTILKRAAEQTGKMHQLKPVTQGTYYLPMVLPYLEGAVSPRGGERFEIVEPLNGWLASARRLARATGNTGPTLFLGDELAAACAPAEQRGRAFGNAPRWRLADVLGSAQAVLARHCPRFALLLVGGSDLPAGHPERTDFEANYALLLKRVLAAGCVPVCATLPPCSHLGHHAWRLNAVIFQAALLHRLPVIELDERMRRPGTPAEEVEPAHEKVPAPEQVRDNRFTEGHAEVVAAELARIIAAVSEVNP